MDFLKILRSIEELLYEVMSWLVFYPRTLWMTLRRPLQTMEYSDREQRDRAEQQYLETLSPPLFLVLSILLAHAVGVAARMDDPEMHGALGEVVSASTQNLLAFRALMFSLHPLLYAAVFLHLSGRKMDRETLRPPFFAQCYLAGATSILVSLSGLGLRDPRESTTLAGLAVILLITGWYLVIQQRWLKRIEGVGPVRAAAWSAGVFLAATAGVFGAGWMLA